MIYEKVVRLCEKKGITIRFLEAELGFGNCTISKWKKSEPTVSNLKKIADYFGVSVDYFLK